MINFEGDVEVSLTSPYPPETDFKIQSGQRTLNIVAKPMVCSVVLYSKLHESILQLYLINLNTILVFFHSIFLIDTIVILWR